MAQSNYKQVFEKVKRETPRRLEKAIQEGTVVTVSKLVMRTPVKTGAARNHWFLRAQPTERFDPQAVDPSGTQSKARAKRDVKLFKLGMLMWIVNSAPYMKYLNAGSSRQAPAGFIDQIYAECKALLPKGTKVSFSKPI